jgi:hypothetical protein
MADQFKLTIKRGQRAQDVVRSAGTAIAGSDAIELNVDATNMSKLDLILMLGSSRCRSRPRASRSKKGPAWRTM